MTSEATFAANALSCVRGDRPIFVNVEFALEPGTILQISGRNGAGKSSLLRILAAFDTPAKGQVVWNNTFIKDDPNGFQQDLHYVSHKNALKSSLSVLEHLKFWAKFGRLAQHQGSDTPPAASREDKQQDLKNAIEKALDTFQLRSLAEVPVRLLSQGQKRRLSLARLVCQNRKLWLLDEPSVGLDPNSVSKLEILIEDHRREGGIVVVVTHTRLTLLHAKKLDMSDHNPALHDLSDFWSL